MNHNAHLYDANLNFVAAALRVLEARGDLNAIELDRALDALQPLTTAAIAKLAEGIMHSEVMLGAPLTRITDADYPRPNKVRINYNTLNNLLVDA